MYQLMYQQIIVGTIGINFSGSIGTSEPQNPRFYCVCRGKKTMRLASRMTEKQLKTLTKTMACGVVPGLTVT